MNIVKLVDLLSIIKPIQDNKSFVLLCLIGAALIFLVGTVLVIRHYYSARFQLKKKLYQNTEILDLNSTINNMFCAKELYDSLKGKCHPDNFSTDLEKFEKATTIFSLLVKSKYNYNALLALKEKAENELGINL